MSTGIDDLFSGDRMKAVALSLSGLLFTQSSPHMAPRPPEQFTGNTTDPITMFYAEPELVDAVCRALIAKGNPPGQQVPPHWTIYACTNTTQRRSILPDPCLPQFAGESFAATACHEKGHANGWGWEYP
jgi:hypothetical protein